jgi:hypothetical protein
MSMLIRFYLPPAFSSRAFHEGCIHFLAALERHRPLGVTVEPIDLWGASHTSIGKADVAIVCGRPLDCANLRDLDARGGGHRASIAITYSHAIREGNAERDWLAGFTQVWLPSMAAIQSFNLTNARLVFVPYDERKHPQVPRKRVIGREQPDRYRFYWAGPWTPLANPKGVIRAFTYTFRSNEPVDLLMRSPVSANIFGEAVMGTGFLDRMIILDNGDGSLPPDQVDAHDCFVTAHRGAAWDLDAFNAMLEGRHVISPRGSGADTYLLGTSAFLYQYVQSIAYHGMHPHDGTTDCEQLDARQIWREPDLLELSRGMRAAFKSRTRTLTVPYNIADRYSYEVVAEAMYDLHLKEACRHV